MDQPAALRVPVSETFAVVVGGIALVLVGCVVSEWFAWKSLGVLVYRYSDGLLYYEFWSSKYHEYLKERVSDRIPRNA